MPTRISGSYKIYSDSDLEFPFCHQFYSCVCTNKSSSNISEPLHKLTNLSLVRRTFLSSIEKPHTSRSCIYRRHAARHHNASPPVSGGSGLYGCLLSLSTALHVVYRMLASYRCNLVYRSQYFLSLHIVAPIAPCSLVRVCLSRDIGNNNPCRHGHGVDENCIYQEWQRRR